MSINCINHFAQQIIQKEISVQLSDTNTKSCFYFQPLPINIFGSKTNNTQLVLKFWDAPKTNKNVKNLSNNSIIKVNNMIKVNMSKYMTTGHLISKGFNKKVSA